MKTRERSSRRIGQVRVALPRYYPASRRLLEARINKAFPSADVEIYPERPSPKGGGIRRAGINIEPELYRILIFLRHHRDLVVMAGTYAGKKAVDIVAQTVIDWIKDRRIARGQRKRIQLVDEHGKAIKTIELKGD